MAQTLEIAHHIHIGEISTTLVDKVRSVGLNGRTFVSKLLGNIYDLSEGHTKNDIARYERMLEDGLTIDDRVWASQGPSMAGAIEFQAYMELTQEERDTKTMNLAIDRLSRLDSKRLNPNLAVL